MQAGITYEDFIQAGGRRVDLAWDVLHGECGGEKLTRFQISNAG